MKAGSMEGLIGASLNMKLTRTPMRVFKAAELKGDTETMKRAMGYVTEFREKAHECSDRAQEQLGKELEEERKEQEARRKKAQEKKNTAKRGHSQARHRDANSKSRKNDRHRGGSQAKSSRRISNRKKR